MSKRQTHLWALKTLGLSADLDIRSDAGYETAMSKWKELTINARNAGNDDEAATLSLCKSLIQKRHSILKSKVCPQCGDAKTAHAARCRKCGYYARRPNRLNELNSMDLHKLENPTLIPESERYGELTLALRALSTGNIGDSFVTNRSSSAVAHAAKEMGGKIITRIANPSEKDKKKRLFRVWRSDGLTMEQVNEHIKKRLAGQRVDKPAPWTPPVKPTPPLRGNGDGDELPDANP